MNRSQLGHFRKPFILYNEIYQSTLLIFFFVILSSFSIEKQRIFEEKRTYIFDIPAEEIIAILSDMNQYGELHPLITSVDKISNEGIETYKVKERPYPLIPIAFSYTASMEIKNNVISYSIKDLPASRATLSYHVSEEDNQTTIKIILRLDSNLLAKKVLLRKMLKAQDKLMQALRDSKSGLKGG